MNGNLICNIILAVCLWGMLYINHQLQKRIDAITKQRDKLHLQWQAWSAAKMQDYPTARLLAGLAREPVDIPPPSSVMSAGATDDTRKEIYTIKQSAE